MKEFKAFRFITGLCLHPFWGLKTGLSRIPREAPPHLPQPLSAEVLQLLLLLAGSGLRCSTGCVASLFGKVWSGILCSNPELCPGPNGLV